jgi:hypothetical protein
LTIIGQGVTLEFIAVKLWLSFEESFQLLHELTDICKSISISFSADSSDHPLPINFEVLSDLLCKYHLNFMSAASALKAISDLTILAYTEGWINLSTLSKSMRLSMADPKKVVIRFQRVYTMWATGGFSYFRIIKQNKSQTNQKKDIVSGYKEDISFESRHALISLSLKCLVDNMTKVSRFVAAKDEKYSLVEELIEVKNDHIIVNWKDPFSCLDKYFPDLSAGLISSWFDFTTFLQRLGRVNNSNHLNILSIDVRRNIVKSNENTESIVPDLDECIDLYLLPNLSLKWGNKRFNNGIKAKFEIICNDKKATIEKQDNFIQAEMPFHSMLQSSFPPQQNIERPSNFKRKNRFSDNSSPNKKNFDNRFAIDIQNSDNIIGKSNPLPVLPHFFAQNQSGNHNFRDREPQHNHYQPNPSHNLQLNPQQNTQQYLQNNFSG